MSANTITGQPRFVGSTWRLSAKYTTSEIFRATLKDNCDPYQHFDEHIKRLSVAYFSKCLDHRFERTNMLLSKGFFQGGKNQCSMSFNKWPFGVLPKPTSCIDSSRWLVKTTV